MKQFLMAVMHQGIQQDPVSARELALLCYCSLMSASPKHPPVLDFSESTDTTIGHYLWQHG